MMMKAGRCQENNFRYVRPKLYLAAEQYSQDATECQNPSQGSAKRQDLIGEKRPCRMRYFCLLRSPGRHIFCHFFCDSARVQLTSVLNVTEYVLGVDSRAMGQT